MRLLAAAGLGDNAWPRDLATYRHELAVAELGGYP